MVMEFVPWKTFGRVVQRHNGDAGVRTVNCSDLFRVMAFAKFNWRESLRDIEACLTAHHAKLFHMELKNVPVGEQLQRVLWNDPATGAMRHADADYELAIGCAERHHLDLPMRR